MSLRLIRAYGPSRHLETELEIRSRAEVEFLTVQEHDEHSVLEVVVPLAYTEDLVTLLEKRYGGHPDFRILVIEVEATLPHKGRSPIHETGNKESSPREAAPVNIEELYTDVRSDAELNWTYVISIGLASIVAATGLLRDSTELIVGSMILAPLLGPSMALSVATALGDLELGKRALVANGVGILVGLASGAFAVLFFDLPLDNTHVTRRLMIGVLDFVVAGTAGIAGALSYTSGAFGRVVGVMIAVALLPPLVLTGMLLGMLEFRAAVNPGLLTLINFIAINLTGVAVLYMRRVRPRPHNDKQTARRAVIGSVVVWSLMLLFLIFLTLLAQKEAIMP